MEGGRTGLAAVTAALLFLVSIFFAPVFTAVPGFATAPALIFVGFMMTAPIRQIDLQNLEEAVPAYICLLCMPLAYSLVDGICLA